MGSNLSGRRTRNRGRSDSTNTNTLSEETATEDRESTSSGSGSSDMDTTSDGNEVDPNVLGRALGTRRNPESPDDLIQVFRVLIRAGEINVMSSDDEIDDPDWNEMDEDDEDHEDEDEYEGSNRPVKRPKRRFDEETVELDKNDIALKIANPSSKLGNVVEFPRLITKQQLGMSNFSSLSSATSSFDQRTRQNISSSFLPNTFRTIANNGYKVFCGSFSKSGDIFLSASQDRTIRIYDTSNDNFGEYKRILARDVGWSVLDTAFSPDGRYVAYSSWSESIHICNITEVVDRHEALPLYPETRRFCIFSIAFSEDGTEILGGANDGFLYVFDRDQNQRVLKIGAHDEDINSVAFADETSKILFSGSDDGLVKVWDRRSMNESDPKPVGILAGHIDGITYVEPKLDGRYLLTNSKDQSMKLWDMRKFSTDDAVYNARSYLEDHTWDYRWQRVPKKLCVTRKAVDGDTSIMTYRGHSVLNTLIRCHFSPSFSTGQRYVYTGCAAGRVVIYDLLSGDPVKSLVGHSGCVRDVSWHPYKPTIVSASWDNSLGLFTYEGDHGIEPDTELLPQVNEKNSELPDCWNKRFALYAARHGRVRRRHPAGNHYDG